MIYCGFDQSMTGSGITIYDGEKYHYYLLKTQRTKNTKCPTIDDTRRLMQVKKEARDILEKHKVEKLAIEGLSFGSRGQAIFQIGGLSHILRELFIEMEIPFVVVPPTVLKKFWTGKGNASKVLMIESTYEKGAEIPFVKKYKEWPEKKFDDNIVDSHALCEFIKVCDDYLDKVECSWNA